MGMGEALTKYEKALDNIKSYSGGDVTTLKLGAQLSGACCQRNASAETSAETYHFKFRGVKCKHNIVTHKNDSEITIVQKIMNFICNFMKKKSPSFPEILRVQNCSGTTKNNSQGILFVIISCQRVSVNSPCSLCFVKSSGVPWLKSVTNRLKSFKIG